LALEHASDALRNDRQLVLEAVRQNGLALEYASDALRNDREVVDGAVRQNGTALAYAGEALLVPAVSRYITSHIPAGVMHGAKTTWRFLSGIGKLVMLVLGILYVAGGIWFGVHDESSSPAVRIFSSGQSDCRAWRIRHSRCS